MSAATAGRVSPSRCASIDALDAAQERYATRPLFPRGRPATTAPPPEVDLEARCEIDRVASSSPQRIRRHADDSPATRSRLGTRG